MGGVSALSADGRATFTPGVTSTSLYKPENGPALNVFGGVHLNDYLSLQGSYIRNRNDVAMISSIAPSQGGATGYEQSRTSRQDGIVGDFLLYFRKRSSWVRPYLATGAGVEFLRSTAKQLNHVSGTPSPPPQEFSAAKAAFRSSVGIDVALGHGVQFRFSFAETIQGNEFSRYLSPPGQRPLAQFQNLFGFVIPIHRP